jgi:hypothetical protein
MPSPQKSVLRQNFTFTQIFKNFPDFFVTRSSVTLFTTTTTLCLSSARILISTLPLFLGKSFCYYCLHKVTAGKEYFQKTMYAGVIVYTMCKLISVETPCHFRVKLFLCPQLMNLPYFTDTSSLYNNYIILLYIHVTVHGNIFLFK